MLPGLVEGHLLIKNPFDRPHHGLEAVHPEGEGFMWLVVSLLLLIREPKTCLLSQFRQKRQNIRKVFHGEPTNLDLKHLPLVSSAGSHHVIS